MDLRSCDHRVVLPDLGGAGLLVVVVTGVLVAVAVQPAVETPAAAREPRETQLLSAHLAPEGVVNSIDKNPTVFQ